MRTFGGDRGVFRPWIFSMPLTMNDDEPVLEFACHEGNYSMPHILSGSREVESSKWKVSVK
jgi:hypothetical protein